MQLNVHAFGKLTLFHAAQQVSHFPTQQTEELLGFLLLHPSRCHTREKLITQLWPEITVSNGRHRFSLVLSRLRAIFKEIRLPFSDFIQTTRDWILFEPERPFFFDRDNFMAECTAGFKMADLSAQEAKLQATLQLYRADLMEGIYANWCLVERERLARLRLRVLGRLMYCCMQRQAFAEAIEFGHTILQEDPLREETHRALMLCYYREERLDRASQQFKSYRQLLQDELGSPPLPETIKLYKEIIDGRVASHFSQTSPRSPIKSQVQLAYDAFLQAADQLETLL